MTMHLPLIPATMSAAAEMLSGWGVSNSVFLVMALPPSLRIHSTSSSMVLGRQDLVLLSRANPGLAAHLESKCMLLLLLLSLLFLSLLNYHYYQDLVLLSRLLSRPWCGCTFRINSKYTWYRNFSMITKINLKLGFELLVSMPLGEITERYMYNWQFSDLKYFESML